MQLFSLKISFLYISLVSQCIIFNDFLVAVQRSLIYFLSLFMFLITFVKVLVFFSSLLYGS
jgi:hypothetical protein